MAQFEVHDVSKVHVAVSDFPTNAVSPFRCVTLTVVHEGGSDVIKLFTRDYNWFVAAGSTAFEFTAKEIA